MLLASTQEMPGDIDYINLGRMIIPLELNYCQCMLELEQYYEVIEHASELLGKHKGKTPSKRGTCWNGKERGKPWLTGPPLLSSAVQCQRSPVHVM